MDLNGAIEREMGSIRKPAYLIFGGLIFVLNVLSPPDVILLVFSSPPKTAFDYNPHAYNAQTIITEWDLVESKSWIPGLLQSLFYVGFMPGTIVCGQLSDKFGRKNIGWISYLLVLIFQIVTGFCQNWQQFAVCRVITGFLVGGRSVVITILAQEMSGGALWSLNGAMGAVAFDTNMLSFLLFAYYFPSWRTLYFLTTIPGVLGFICFLISPESPRWLLSQGRVDEAEKVVMRLARWNGSDCTEYHRLHDVHADEASALSGPTELETLQDKADEKSAELLATESQPFDDATSHDESAALLVSESQSANRDTKRDPLSSVAKQAKKLKNSILDIFTDRVLRYRAGILGFQWFTVSFVYYCITLGSGSFNPNFYLAFAISAFSQLPAIPIFMFFMERSWSGRRRTLAALFLAAAVGLSTIYILPYTKANASYRLVLFLISKIGASGAFSLIYVFTPELFPTAVRNVGLGAMSTCARVGSMTAPFLANYTVNTGSPAPFLAFGIVSGLSGMLALHLPETRGKKIIITLDDAYDQEEVEAEET